MRHVTGRTRVKICGIRRAEDLAAAIAAGADSVGLVFCEKSPRHLELAQARSLAVQIPAFVSLVALFLNPDAAQVQAVIQSIKPDLLQFHGQEDAGFCEQFDRRYLKAVALGGTAAPQTVIQAQQAAHPQACGLILDSHQPGAIGGTGETFAWTDLNRIVAPLIVAGGLHPGNVAQAIRTMRPWAVDVSSGVEDAPGIKSAAKIADFILAVRAADAADTPPTGI